MPTGGRPYFSERQGRGPKAGPLSVQALRKLIFNTWDSLEGQYYFQEAFGYHCVDEGVVAGTIGTDPEAHFLRVLGREHMWPYRSLLGGPSTEDELFDMTEALYDLVSEPLNGRHHDYANCGWHYTLFDKTAGQIKYRADINDVLQLCEPPYELTPSGEIVQATPDEFRQLMGADVPPGTEHDEVTKRIESAKRAFVARHSSDDDRRMAVVELAGVLEALKVDVNATMMSSDERDLFKLANKFALRHNDPQQQRNYDHAVWHRWMFYVYLATIHAVLRVRDRPTG